MYDPPGYLWAITIAGMITIPGATSVLLYAGARRAGQGRARSALLAAASAVVLGAWFTASAVIARHGWYHTQIGHGVPWMPVVVAGFLGTLLALGRIPAVKRALTAPGMVSRLELPHAFRVFAGLAFLLTMALGHLPALLAVPAGLGDVATGIATPLVARKVAHGTGRRAGLWLNAFGFTDLVNALILGALTGFQLVHVTPAATAITEFPLALIPTAAVPLLLALHVVNLRTLAKAPRTAMPANARPIAGAGSRAAAAAS
jgi:hypothetical protein